MPGKTDFIWSNNLSSGIPRRLPCFFSCTSVLPDPQYGRQSFLKWQLSSFKSCKFMKHVNERRYVSRIFLQYVDCLFPYYSPSFLLYVFLGNSFEWTYFLHQHCLTGIWTVESSQNFIFHSESRLAVTHVSFLVTVYKVHFIHIKQLLSQGKWLKIPLACQNKNIKSPPIKTLKKYIKNHKLHFIMLIFG